MYKLMLFTLCLAVMAAGAGLVGLGMLLGASAFGLGAAALALTGWGILTR